MIKIEEIFKTFGVVFQKDALFDSLLVWENIMFKSLSISKKHYWRNHLKYLKRLDLKKVMLFYIQLNYPVG